MSRYCSESDLYNLGIPAQALESFLSAEKLAAIDAFSSEMDGYLPPRYRVADTSAIALESLPKSMRMHCARGAVYVLMSARGLNPTAAGNALIIKGYDDAIAWLRNVARGIVTLPTIAGVPTAVVSPAVYSDESRWGAC